MQKFVIMLSGRMRSGKNQFATYLEAELKSFDISVRQDLFAKDLKDGCKEDFKALAHVLASIRAELISTTEIYASHAHIDIQALNQVANKLLIKDENWYEDKTDITRTILQLYGTEIFRKKVGENYWTHRVRVRVIESSENITLITDARFPNEITVFSKENLGEYADSIIPVAIRINRTINTDSGIAGHASEVSLDDWNEWDYIVDNNGTLEDLKGSAKVIAEELITRFV